MPWIHKDELKKKKRWYHKLLTAIVGVYFLAVLGVCGIMFYVLIDEYQATTAYEN